ncbi:MAG TPA: autorepressor SdpR family transcription factor [Opitutaceae bacterium]|jgi:DNA-binding transcriptional ArsR family regulator
MRDVYRALSDPTRRAIISLLRKGDLSAGDLAGHFPFSKPTMSQHFTVLKEARLIEGRRDGTTIIYTLNVSVLEDALSHLLDAFNLNPKVKNSKKGAHASNVSP